MDLIGKPALTALLSDLLSLADDDSKKRLAGVWETLEQKVADSGVEALAKSAPLLQAFACGLDAATDNGALELSSVVPGTSLTSSVFYCHS